MVAGRLQGQENDRAGGCVSCLLLRVSSAGEYNLVQPDSRPTSERVRLIPPANPRSRFNGTGVNREGMPSIRPYPLLEDAYQASATVSAHCRNCRALVERYRPGLHVATTVRRG